MIRDRFWVCGGRVIGRGGTSPSSPCSPSQYAVLKRQISSFMLLPAIDLLVITILNGGSHIGRM